MPAWPSAHAPEGVLLGLVGAAAFLASAHTPEGVLLRASALLASAHAPEGVLLRASALLASAHTPEGVLLRASAPTPGCVSLGLIGVAALSRVSPRARGRVAPGFCTHVRVRVARACRHCGSFSRQSARPRACLLRASAHTAECLLLGIVGAAALSHVSPTRPRACCSGPRRARLSACCSAVSVLRLFLASAHAPKCVLLGLVGVAAPSRIGPRARGRVAPGSGARARVRVARPCRRCGSFPRQPTRRRACCSGLRPTSPSACCSGLSALTPSLVAWDCRHCAERLFLASDRPPGRGARVCWRCGAFSVRCCRRGCGLA